MSGRRPSLIHRGLVLILRLFLGGLFIYASVHKLQDPVAFSKIIYNYKILPGFLINMSAIVLPGVELVAGIMLIIGFMSRGAALIITASLLVFICAISYNLARGLEFDCGCFSFSRSTKGAAVDLLIRDLIFLAMALRMLCARGFAWSLDWLFGLEPKQHS
ncbi:MAG: DoxX family membrane protein [Candidatus Aureabacteria bacterium]|nr:DoxX family membrane protein [Candidatus Auribacterota bacterium]